MLDQLQMHSLKKPFYQRVWGKIRKTIRNLVRQRLRNQVAFSPPSPVAERGLPFSPHTLVCHQDILLAICSSKALNLAMERALPWVFHDDGSLTSEDIKMLSCHFPGSRIVERKESDLFYKATENIPFVRRLRKMHVMLLKLGDLHVYSPTNKILYVDSDVLFLKKPDFLLARLFDDCAGNYFNKDIASAYITDSQTIKSLTGVQPPERINAGLSILKKDDIALDKIEGILIKLNSNLRNDWNYYGHLIEQSVVAVLAAQSQGGAFHLPHEYDVSLDKEVSTAACKHYVGVIRDLYELEGLKFLIEKKEFLQRWSDFVIRRKN